MKILNLTTILLFCVSGLFAQNISVSPGTHLTATNGSNIGISDCNFVNNSNAVAMNGKVTFTGNNAQIINGISPITFTDLVIDNSNNVMLQNDVAVSSQLNLSNGILDIQDQNLMFSASSIITGSFSNSAMIATSGSGSVKMGINSTGSYFFPIGSNGTSPSYSPAQFDFSSGNFSGSTLSVKVSNSKQPNISGTTDYLNRYWTVSETGIGSFACNVDFQYVSGDVIGNESSFSGAQWNGSSWAMLNQVSGNHFTGNVNSFGDFTAGSPASIVSVNEITNSELNIKLFSDGNQLIIQPSTDIQIKNIEIYNALGQLISSKKINSYHSEAKLPAAAGIYVIRIQTDKGYFVQKMFLQ
jgi:hypothetical protein